MRKTALIVAVKGGVGKSLGAINIAYYLKGMGHKVGLLDCDFDNSNFAQFTNTDAEITVDPTKGFQPYDWDGIQVFSMSLVAGRSRSVSLTGDRYWQFMDDIVRRSEWNVDYFVADLPSGSGDVFKAAVHVFGDELAGDIIIIQPSMMDATRRVLNLHKYFEIPVLGIIENMSYFVCEKHNKPLIYYPFGESVVDQVAEEYGVDVLGKIPLIPDMPEKIKLGNPILEGDAAKAIEAACAKIVEAPVQKPGFLERMKTKVLEKLKTTIEKVLAQIIVALNREIAIGEVRTATGFTEEKPFLIRIVDESMTTEITTIALRIKRDRVVVLREPREVDYEIIGSFKTFARIIMGKRRVDGDEVPFSAMDAWLNGDVVTAGMGYAPKAVHALRTIFRNEPFMEQIRERYGGLLERWI